MTTVSTPDDLAELRDILETVLDLDLPDLAMDTDLYADLGMDSMGAVAMVVEIQRRFAVRLPDEQVPSLTTAGAILDALRAPTKE